MSSAGNESADVYKCREKRVIDVPPTLPARCNCAERRAMPLPLLADADENNWMPLVKSSLDKSYSRSGDEAEVMSATDSEAAAVQVAAIGAITDLLAELKTDTRSAKQHLYADVAAHRN